MNDFLITFIAGLISGVLITIFVARYFIGLTSKIILKDKEGITIDYKPTTVDQNFTEDEIDG